jgi:hypothetical protein
VRRPCINCGHELDLTTDEERAVIEAADNLEKHLTDQGYFPIVEMQCGEVAHAVRALRASRQPSKIETPGDLLRALGKCKTWSDVAAVCKQASEAEPK